MSRYTWQVPLWKEGVDQAEISSDLDNTLIWIDLHITYSCLQKGWRFPIWVSWKQTKQNKPYCRVYLKFTLSHSRSRPSVFRNHNVLLLLLYLIYYLYSRCRSVCHFLSKCIISQHKNGGDSRAGRALDFASFYILFTHCMFIGGFTYNRWVYEGGMMGTEAKPYNWVHFV